jgi:CHAD domain-containing protein
MEFVETVIDQTAEKGARLVALTLLQRSDSAARRLAKREDEEALHDLRVALRRLRTALRSFRPWLASSVGRTDEKRLRRLTKQSNPARDAEVHLAFLETQGGGARHQIGVDLMRERLEARRREGVEIDELMAKYRRISRKLARRLPRYELRLDVETSRVTYGAVLAGAVRDELSTVLSRLGDVSGPGDEEHVHRGRIAVKRLRYLLEPLRGSAYADTDGAVKELKRLQTVLGDLHDMHTLARELKAALLDAAAKRDRRFFEAAYETGANDGRLRDQLRRGARAGLLGLVRLVRERRDALFADLDHSWLKGGLDVLAKEVERIAAALEARGGGEAEIERRFLLTAIPSRAESAPTVEISVGRLHGQLLRESLRRVRSADGDRYWRGVVHDEGDRHVRTEEETTREVFDALWPQTQGRRETRQRREVSDGGVTWFLDRVIESDTIVAEARLPPRLAVPLPEWLAPFVVRELTEPPEQLPDTPAAGGGPGDRAEPVQTGGLAANESSPPPTT